jgi:hypothetical protein
MTKFLMGEVLGWPVDESLSAMHVVGGYYINDRDRVLGSLPHLKGRYRDVVMAHLKEAQVDKKKKGLPFIPLEDLEPRIAR